MTERVVVENQSEFDDPEFFQRVKEILEPLGHTTEQNAEHVLVYASNCNNPEEEITNLLDDAGLYAFVYLP